MDNKRLLLQVTLAIGCVALLATAAKTHEPKSRKRTTSEPGCVTNCTEEEKSKFEEFKVNFTRTYTNESEECEALNHFCVAYRAVKEHNADKGQTFKRTITGQADKSPEVKAEMKAKRTGMIVDDAVLKSAKKVSANDIKLSAAKLKGSMDKLKAKSTLLRGTASELNLGPFTGAVKDQGTCGSCWAFCTNAVQQFQAYVFDNRTVVLSEQDFVDCNTKNSGCEGGSPYFSFAYAQQRGTPNQFQYPYRQTQGGCRRSATVQPIYKPIGESCLLQLNETNLKDVIDQIGVVAIGIGIADSFMQYTTGIYSDRSCPTRAEHCVNIVGYGTDANGVDYWVVKNSWGRYWGMNGYVRMRRGVNTCGIGLGLTYVACTPA